MRSSAPRAWRRVEPRLRQGEGQPAWRNVPALGKSRRRWPRPAPAAAPRSAAYWHDSRLRLWSLNHVSGGAINPQWIWRFREYSEFTSAFGDIADIAGLAAGSTQSQMTLSRLRLRSTKDIDELVVEVAAARLALCRRDRPLVYGSLTCEGTPLRGQPRRQEAAFCWAKAA
jgi:hypothetical protein